MCIVVDDQDVSQVECTTLVAWSQYAVVASCWDDVLRILGKAITIIERRSICWHLLREWSIDCANLSSSCWYALGQCGGYIVCCTIDEFLRVIQNELNWLNSVVQWTNLRSVCCIILHCEVTPAWCVAGFISTSNPPSIITVEVVRTEVCWQNNCRFKLTVCFVPGQIRVSKILCCLHVAYCYIEWTTIRVCQSTVIVDSVYTETDNITLNIVHVLDGDSTLAAFEQLSRLVLITYVLVSVRVPCVQLWWSRFLSELLIKCYIESLDALSLGVTEVDGDRLTLFYC